MKNQEKKAYAAPKLVVHGDVQALTLCKTPTPPKPPTCGSHIVSKPVCGW